MLLRVDVRIRIGSRGDLVGIRPGRMLIRLPRMLPPEKSPQRPPSMTRGVT
jgi:hypothetical protein